MKQKTINIPDKKKNRTGGRPKNTNIGRPLKYLPDLHNELVYNMRAGRGLTKRKIAKLLQIGKTTLYQWFVDYPAFKAAWTKGDDEWNNKKVKKSLLVRALGYRYTETTREPVATLDKDGQAVNTLEIVKTVRKHVIPDVGAIKHWQVNRDPENWSDKQRREITGKDGGPVALVAFPDKPLSLAEWEKQMEEADEKRENPEEPKKLSGGNDEGKCYAATGGRPIKDE